MLSDSPEAIRWEGIQARLLKARRAKAWKTLRKIASEMLEEDPEDVYAVQLAGESYEKEGAVDLAIQQYEAALRIDSRATGALGHSLFYRRLDIIYNRAKKYNDCLRVCRQYTDRHPDYWDAWNRLGRAATNGGDDELGKCATAKAGEIRQASERSATREKARTERWLALYQARLAELGFGPDGHRSLDTTAPAPARESDPPDYGASEDEWVTWILESTDFDEIDARQQAIMDAMAQLLNEEEEQTGDSGSQAELL